MNRSALRTLVRGAYDIQKLRIQTGNRLVANVKVKLGQQPGRPEESMDAEGKAILASLRACYDRITDAAQGFPKMKSFEGDEIISSYTELCLVDQYFQLLDSETRHFKQLKSVLDEYPVWTQYLEGVTGVGPAMAGVIISEIDIAQAKYPSSLWSYAGLDVMTDWVLQRTTIQRGNLAKKEPTLDIPFTITGLECEEQCTIDGGSVIGREILVDDDEPDRVPESDRAVDCKIVAVVRFEKDGYVIDAMYRMFHYGGRSRRKEHLVEREYVDKDGKPATRVGITFNPWLKTKLVGVLAGSFLKQRADRCKYRRVYDDYKHRLESDPRHAEKTKGHRHNMAMRYTIKIFLADLYDVWRKLEGLPATTTYHEAKLGHKHDAA